MKKDGFFSLRVFPLLFMFAVTVVCITVVTGLHLSTKERVEANESLFLKKTILEAAGISFPDDFREVNTIYDQRVIEKASFYEATREDGSIAYVIQAQGAGLWGLITLMVGFGQDLQELTGIGIVSQNETPGLGARIEEPWYKEQFRGKRGPFRLVEEGTASAPDQIDSITGATRTSQAMLSILNKAVVDGPATVKGE